MVQRRVVGVLNAWIVLFAPPPRQQCLIGRSRLFAVKALLLRSSLVLIVWVTVLANAPAIHAKPRAMESAEWIRSTSDRAVTVRDLPPESGAFQRVRYDAPPAQVRGVVVMFAGGADDLGIKKNGDIKHADNFVVRSRDLWIAKGYGVVLVDAIGRQSMRGKRSSAAYAAVTQQIVAFAQQQSAAPVWVLGTSQGSIAAMNAASHAIRTPIAGVILTESVSVLGGSHETVFDAHPEDVRVPALVVANQDDRCKVAPPSMARAIAQSLHNTQVSVLFVHGGITQSPNACASLSPHGYDGIERSVVDQITAWMASVAS
jgi:hypothetical protein